MHVTVLLMHPVPVYSLSPRQIVDAMFTKHGQTTGPDLQKLRDPLLKLLPALAELETHMKQSLHVGVNQAHGERTRGKPLPLLRDVPRIRQGLPRAPAAATRLLYHVPYGKPAKCNGAFRISPPSHSAHDG
jgi:hypothetical protein